MDTGPLARLVGHELDMVSFVRDYVELRVDYSILRALTGPTGCIDGINWRLSDEGSADRLRGYIGLTVSAVQVVDDDHITLVFDSGDRIDVSLRPDDRVGPEAAHFARLATFCVQILRALRLGWRAQIAESGARGRGAGRPLARSALAGVAAPGTAPCGQSDRGWD